MGKVLTHPKQHLNATSKSSIGGKVIKPCTHLTLINLRKKLTLFNKNEFVKGDQVKVIDGQYSGYKGEVDLSYSNMTEYGLYEKVWVRFNERTIYAYSPEHLLMVSPNYSLRPAQQISSLPQ